MPVGIVVNSWESRLVREIWPEPKGDDPRVVGNIVEFSQAGGRDMMACIQLHAALHPDDAGPANRFIDRLVGICGSSLLFPKSKPVETETVSGDNGLIARTSRNGDGDASEEHF